MKTLSLTVPFLLSLVACAGSEASLLHTALTPEQLGRLEEAPPPKFVPLSQFQPPPNKLERRRTAKQMFTAGTVASAVGAALLISGGLMYAVPSSCDHTRDWFCDLPQTVTGVAFMLAGGVHVLIGVGFLGSGGMAAREARSQE
jgi:hypothetical protein